MPRADGGWVGELWRPETTEARHDTSEPGDGRHGSGDAGKPAGGGWMGEPWGASAAETQSGEADATSNPQPPKGVKWAPLPDKHIAGGWRMFAQTERRAGRGRGSGHAAACSSFTGQLWDRQWGAEGRGDGNGAAKGRRKAIQTRIESCGLDAPLGPRKPDEWLGKRPRDEAETLVAQLRSSIAEGVSGITETDRLRTALTWFEDFVGDTDRVPFVDPTADGGSLYNQETLDMFAAYMRWRGSRRRGKKGKEIKAAHIGSMVSAVRMLRERNARRLITDKANNLVAPQLFRQWRKEDGPTGERKLSRALRAMHLRAAALAGADRSSEHGQCQWAVATTSTILLLRGGEPGTTSKGKGKGPIDWKRVITCGDIDFRDPNRESKGRPWLVIDVVGIKDTQFTNRKVPMVICRRHKWGEAALGADPVCAYDALLIHWRNVITRVPAAQRVYQGGSTTPLFTNVKGEVWRTTDSRQLAKDLAKLVGINPDEVGGKAFRIGGATDLRDAFGEGASRLIKERGRWASDVAQLYQRALLRTQLDASVGAGDADSRDLEEMLPGWVQPATYYTLTATA